MYTYGLLCKVWVKCVNSPGGPCTVMQSLLDNNDDGTFKAKEKSTDRPKIVAVKMAWLE
jgi:hypothetical protein